MGDQTPSRASAERFRGFGSLYDEVRPRPPARLGDLLVRYSGGSAALTVDLGSGTGTSTRWAASWSREVIGVEPSADMREVAERSSAPAITYIDGWSHDTQLPASIADVVLAVQALHWMEPDPTFREVQRLLRPRGVFAAVDCDWPPATGDHLVEKAWEDCRRRVMLLGDRLSGAGRDADVGAPEIAAHEHSGSDAHGDREMPDGSRSWAKTDHLARMKASGAFDWCRELVVVGEEDGAAERYIGLLRSQGDYQALRRGGFTDADIGFDGFEQLVRRRMGSATRSWMFSWRVRLGIATDSGDARHVGVVLPS